MMTKHIPITEWGRDHWGTFAYIETLCVDAQNGVGEIVRDRMRTDPVRHPMLEGIRNRNFRNFGPPHIYPTHLKGGVEVVDHDDWDCLCDLERASLVWVGTYTSGYVKMTALGQRVAGELRAHKSSGGQLDTFTPSKRLLVQMEAAQIGAGAR